MAERVGRKHGIAVCNGSAALDAAAAALQLGRGEEVILPAFTIISCAQAVMRAGATPVLVDSEPDTWNMDVSQIEARITPRTRAIMAVHIYGLPVDMGPVLEMAGKHGLKVIEDAAEAIGQVCRARNAERGTRHAERGMQNGGGRNAAEPISGTSNPESQIPDSDNRPRPCGSFGDVSTLSFYPNKHVTTGEGGMVLTDDDDLAERCRSLRNLCFQRERRFVHEELGWNFRMSNLQAAVGVAQLERLDESLARKREIGRRYTERLGGVPGLQLPLERTSYAENLYWVYGVVLDDDVPLDAGEMMRRLRAEAIGTRPFFWPMHEQPVLRRMGLFKDVRLPVAERLARRGLYLPSGLALTDEQIDEVAAAVKAALS